MPELPNREKLYRTPILLLTQFLMDPDPDHV